MKNEVYITCGCGNKFDPLRFRPIKNRPEFCKPSGGLWSSPVNSTYGWRDWCKSEDFHRGEPGTEFKFHLKEGSRVYKIDNVYDLISVPYKTQRRYIRDGKMIDFEGMAKEYDAILLTVNGEHETRYSDREFGMDLYGWDCETLLVLRPECIVEEV